MLFNTRLQLIASVFVEHVIVKQEFTATMFEL